MRQRQVGRKRSPTSKWSGGGRSILRVRGDGSRIGGLRRSAGIVDRGSAAKRGGMDRQTLRDWVHRFNASGPEGLLDNWTDGPKPRLSEEQLAQFFRRSWRP